MYTQHIKTLVFESKSPPGPSLYIELIAQSENKSIDFQHKI